MRWRTLSNEAMSGTAGHRVDVGPRNWDDERMFGDGHDEWASLSEIDPSLLFWVPNSCHITSTALLCAIGPRNLPIFEMIGTERVHDLPRSWGKRTPVDL